MHRNAPPATAEFRNPAALSGFIRHGGCRLYYEVCGQGRPLALLHGLAADLASWLPVKRLLAEHFTLILTDNRLSGRSSAGPSAVTAKTVARDLKTVLDGLGIKKAAVLGHSMGGYAAQEFAALFPKAVSALILESTAATASARDRALFAAWSETLSREGYTEQFWRCMFPWMLSPEIYAERPDFAEAAVKAASGYQYLPSPDKFARQAGLAAAFNGAGILKKIKAPALVISGERDILITPHESRALAAGIAKARFTLMRGAGHIPHLERPAAFCRLLSDFLARHP
ncbi:MAG: alpha/beta hydrolase [Elusimicrobiales bacterium]